jgi:hypothetical protein
MGSEALPASHSKDTKVLSPAQSGLDMAFTARLHLQPRLRMSGAVTVLHPYAFMASRGRKLYFYLFNYFNNHILRYYYCYIITLPLFFSLIIVLVSLSISRLPP